MTDQDGLWKFLRIHHRAQVLVVGMEVVVARAAPVAVPVAPRIQRQHVVGGAEAAAEIVPAMGMQPDAMKQHNGCFAAPAPVQMMQAQAVDFQEVAGG